MITSAANAIVLQAVIDVTLDVIDSIALYDGETEIFSKTATDITELSSTKKQYTFFISEAEGNGDITQVKLLAGAVIYSTQPLVITKNNNQSLNIEWIVEVV